MNRRAAPCLALSAALLAVPPDACAAEAADLVLKNAVVHTVDAKRPRAEAVAVRGNRIVAVGSSAEVQALVGPTTRVLDLAGRTVVPGFDDVPRALARHRLRAARRRPGRHAQLRRRGRAGGEGGEDSPPRRVDARPRLARGQVGRTRAGGRARLPHARGADRRLARQPGRPRASGRPCRARQREGDGAQGSRARRGLPRAARSSATRRASRPASSSTTRKAW